MDNNDTNKLWLFFKKVSYFKYLFKSLCSAWPGYTFYSPVIFARHWKLLLSGFLKGYKSVGGILVKFEDLIEGKIPLKDIAAHIRVKSLDSKVLNKKIGSPKGINKKSKKINLCERIILQCIGGSLLKKLGYKHINL